MQMRTMILAILTACLILAGVGSVSAEERAYIPVMVRIPQMIIMKLDATELVFNEVDFDYVLGLYPHLTAQMALDRS